MVFTVLHALISFIVFRFSSFEFFSFFAGVVAPDIEAVYFMKEAYSVCEPNDYKCLAEYPSHWFLHSFLGITFSALLIAVFVYSIRKRFNLKKFNLKNLFISAWIGGVTHLIVDSTVHKGEDALMLFFPYPEKYSFVFPYSHIFWYAVSLIGLVLLIISLKDFKKWLS